MAEAAGQEDESDHKTKEKKRDISVRGKFRERHSRSSKREVVAREEKVCRVLRGNSMAAETARSR
jgi:hypothetical protein